MTLSTRFLAALAAAAATAGTVAFPAYAQDVTKTIEVRYADLNLSAPSGAQLLKARVERAAKRICEAHGDRSLATELDARNCTRVAIARAMPQVELALANAGTQVAENSRLTVAAH